MQDLRGLADRAVGGRGLRGTVLDVFGYAEVRRVERELVGEHRALVDTALGLLAAGSASQVAAIAALPDVVRGYEDIKLRNVAEFRRRAEDALRELGAYGPERRPRT